MGWMGGLRWTIALGFVAACGPRDATPSAGVPMRSVCGQPEGPIQLLALEDHEQLASLVRAGDHWLAAVDVYDRPVVPSPAEGSDPGSIPLPARELRTFDACGDDSRTVFEHFVSLGQRDDRWFSCDATQGLMWFDPAGSRTPQRVASCGRYAVIDGDLVVEERDPEGGLGTLVRLSLAEDRGPEPVW